MGNWERHTLMSTLKNIGNNLLDLTKPILTKTLLFGSNSFDINTNTNILNAIMNLVYLLKDLTNRFFIEFTDYCRNEVLHKKIKQICIYLTSNTIITINNYLR